MRPPTEAEPSYWFALAAEDAEHHAAVTRLTDRVLEARVEWFTPQTRDAIRRWREPAPTSPYWKVTSAFTKARELRLPLRGHFEGKDELEASLYRAQLLVWKHAHEHGQPIHVGFIARDADRKPRRAGAERAVESGKWPFEIVLAFPEPEIEAWRIAVFTPRTQRGRDRLVELTRRLGFSPVEHPERLTSTVSGAATDVKTVRDMLFSDGEDGGGDWLEIELDVLGAQGKSCGLTDFLKQIGEVVAGRLGAAPRSD